MGKLVLGTAAYLYGKHATLFEGLIIFIGFAIYCSYKYYTTKLVGEKKLAILVCAVGSWLCFGAILYFLLGYCSFESYREIFLEISTPSIIIMAALYYYGAKKEFYENPTKENEEDFKWIKKLVIGVLIIIGITAIIVCSI